MRIPQPLWSLSVALALAALSGCATLPDLSPMERRAMQSRTHSDISYENVFLAYRTVLQDDGYVLKTQDMAGGLLTGAVHRGDHAVSSDLAAVASLLTSFSPEKAQPDPTPTRTGAGFEISIGFEKLGDRATEARATIQSVETYSNGRRDVDEVLDPDSYRAFFDRVRVELERRKAMGRI